MDDDKRGYEQARDELARLQRGELPVRLANKIPADPRALDEADASQLVAMMFRSRSGNTQPHLVTLRPEGETSCTCDARTTCWAVKAFRKVRGMYVATPSE